MKQGTFFVISTINTIHTKIDPDERFRQTINTIQSIKLHSPGSNILFLDNSTTPITDNQAGIIASMVDDFVPYEPNLYVKYVNHNGSNKGLNEMLAYEALLKYAIKKGCIRSRLFKISGRYRLTPRFVADEYAKLQYAGKYVFRISTWFFGKYTAEGKKVTGHKDFYNTAIWSMCSTLVPEYKALMQDMFNWMVSTGENIEMAHNTHIPKEKLVIIPSYGLEGYITNGEWTEV